MKRVVKTAAVLTALCLLCGCGARRVESISFDAEEIEMDVGTARNLNPKVVPEAMADKAACHSGDEEIASYENGLVVAHKTGTCALYATVGDEMSGFVKLTVHDYASEANALNERIKEYYESGRMNRDIAAELGAEYDEFPDYAKEIVDNFYILRVYRNYDGTAEVYITKSGSSYHAYGCRQIGGSGFGIPYVLAELEQLKPCKVCEPEPQG